MKKLTTIAIAVLAMAACTPKQTGYQVNGTVADSTLNGKSVYLSDRYTNVPIDTAVIENNTFCFSGTLDAPSVVRMTLGQTRVNMLLDNSMVVTIADKNADGGEISISDNGGINDKQAKLLSDAKAISQQARDAYEEMQQEGLSNEEIGYKMEEYNTQMNELYRQSIIENKDNLLGAFVLGMTAKMYDDLTQLDSMISIVKYADRVASIDAHKKNLESKEATKAGKMFVDFPGKNIDGTPAKLSDYVGKGKYVLADFWASWCGPCRGEIPNLIELQNKYGGDKFTVLGINVWDRENEFKKALEEEKINYSQLYASDDQNATTLYGIQGIPQIILFAPDGTIVARDLRGESMKKKVAEVLGE